MQIPGVYPIATQLETQGSWTRNLHLMNFIIIRVTGVQYSLITTKAVFMDDFQYSSSAVTVP